MKMLRISPRASSVSFSDGATSTLPITSPSPTMGWYMIRSCCPATFRVKNIGSSPPGVLGGGKSLSPVWEGGESGAVRGEERATKRPEVGNPHLRSHGEPIVKAMVEPFVRDQVGGDAERRQRQRRNTHVQNRERKPEGNSP